MGRAASREKKDAGAGVAQSGALTPPNRTRIDEPVAVPQTGPAEPAGAAAGTVGNPTDGTSGHPENTIKTDPGGSPTPSVPLVPVPRTTTGTDHGPLPRTDTTPITNTGGEPVPLTRPDPTSTGGEPAAPDPTPSTGDNRVPVARPATIPASIAGYLIPLGLTRTTPTTPAGARDAQAALEALAEALGTVVGRTDPR